MLDRSCENATNVSFWAHTCWLWGQMRLRRTWSRRTVPSRSRMRPKILIWPGWQKSPMRSRKVWDMLKAVDPTFTITSERDLQSRNDKATEFELLLAYYRITTLSNKDHHKPVPYP